MFQETQGKGAAADSILRSIMGTETVIDIDGECRGLFEADKGPDGFPTLFAVYGQRLYMIKDGDKYEIYSDLTNYNTPVHMTQTGGSHPHLVIVDGANVIAVDTTLTLEEMRNDIRSIQLPYRVDSETQRIIPTHVAYTYNYLIVNDSTTDNIYFSHEFPVENTTSTDEIDYDIFMVNSVQYKDYGFHEQASWSPDNVTALISNSTLLYTFGPKSSQIWTNNSDVDAPFVSPTNCVIYSISFISVVSPTLTPNFRCAPRRCTLRWNMPQDARLSIRSRIVFRTITMPRYSSSHIL